MVTRLQARQPENWVSTADRSSFILFFIVSRPVLGTTQVLIQWIPRTIYPRVKPPRRETDHSLSSAAAVKNAWSYASALSYGMVLN
jgi:hypothetical protein